MSKFIIGKKNTMTRQFLPDGEQVPVTIVDVLPCVVTAVKTVVTDGYQAVQFGYGKKKKLGTAVRGIYKEVGSFEGLHEFRMLDKQDYQVGQKIDLSQFIVGEKVKVVGVAKGLGFQGVVKRHGFSGQPATHGHKDQLRMPGSIGSGGVQKVFKGLRMAGRMGGQRTTVLNLEVAAVKPEINQLWLKGAVPGARKGLLFIQA
ncbi:MAG: 50S ribosomal protein L3 [Patescibacteria group bacterium]